MSIGSNDLTQLVLGLDRDSGIISHIGDERDEAVKEMLREVIKIARRKRKYIGICGQAPSDWPEIARFLARQRIDSISLNPDSVLKTTLALARFEKKNSRMRA
jgi:pyruvate,water dikinase